ncbi:MAG: hypothetical protein R3F11_03065 [Verrucomicrobiales bacterium]
MSDRLMEGGMVEQDHGRNVYESIRYQRRDPALLEWLDGSVFKMRIFPIEARSPKRVLLSYTQRLESAYGKWRYRFPGGHTMANAGAWACQIRVKDGAAERAPVRWECDYTYESDRRGGATVWAGGSQIRPDRDITLTLIENAGADEEGDAASPMDLDDRQDADATLPPQQDAVARFCTAGDSGGDRYLMLRLRPDLKDQNVRAQGEGCGRDGKGNPRRDWIVLFEASANRTPALAAAGAELAAALLRNGSNGDTVTAFTANTRIDPLAADPIAADAAAIHRVAEFGAGAERRRARSQCRSRRHAAAANLENLAVLHLGAGVATIATATSNRSLSPPPQAEYIGIGVGDQWNRTLMRAAASRAKRGGYFAQVTPGESAAWRGFEIAAALNAPRLLGIQVQCDGGIEFLTPADAIADGEELLPSPVCRRACAARIGGSR